MLLANRKSCNLVSKDKFPKGTASANSWSFHVWRSLAQNTFLFQEPECDPVPEIMISCQKIGLVVVVFTALHGMQTRSSNVCPSVCLSNAANVWFVTEWKKVFPCILIPQKKTIYPSFVTKRMVGGGDPFCLKFWVKPTTLERNRRFSVYFHP